MYGATGERPALAGDAAGEGAHTLGDSRLGAGRGARVPVWALCLVGAVAGMALLVGAAFAGAASVSSVQSVSENGSKPRSLPSISVSRGVLAFRQQHLGAHFGAPQQSKP